METVANNQSELVLPAPSVIWFTLSNGIVSDSYTAYSPTMTEVLFGLLIGGMLRSIARNPYGASGFFKEAFFLILLLVKQFRSLR